jgi:hypothetical protein
MRTAQNGYSSYLCRMSTIRKKIAGLPLVMERKDLAPNVITFMISVEGDLVQFPMVYKKEFGGWIFVDKMTPIDFVERQKEISDELETNGFK